MLDGRRAAFFTSLGICAGLPVHATASALGLVYWPLIGAAVCFAAAFFSLGRRFA